MSSESNVGGGNAHNGQTKADSEQYGSDNDNSMVEYRVLDDALEPPKHHEHLTGTLHRGPTDDIDYQQLAGQGAIEIVEASQEEEFNGPPEPLVSDRRDIRVALPNENTAVPLGKWECKKCGNTQRTEIENGSLSEPEECHVCGKPVPWKHAGDLDDSQIQAALRADEMWKPATDTQAAEYAEIWADVRSFIYDHWDAEESEIYDGLTAYALSTWVRPNLTFVPHLMLMGKTTGGKTRLLNTLSHVSYRAVVAASATPASMFRMIDGYNVSYFVSEYHGLGPDEQRELDNVVRAGQKKGEKITRAEQSTTGFEPRTYDPFSHIAIATQYTPADDIVNRCIQIRSSRSNRDMPATIDEQRAEQIRNKLLDARFRLLDSDRFDAAEAEAYAYLEQKGITGRTREKLLSLLSMVIVCDALDAFEPYVETICQQDKEAVSNSEDARFVEVLRDLAHEAVTDVNVLNDSDPYASVEIQYSDIVDKYEQVNGVEKSPTWVGHIRSRLDFDKKRKSNGSVIRDAELRPKLKQHCEEHNLGWKPNEPVEHGDSDDNPKGSTDGTRLTTRLREHIEGRYPIGDFSASQVASTFDGDAEEEQIEEALEELAEKDGSLERYDGRYSFIGGEA